MELNNTNRGVCVCVLLLNVMLGIFVENNAVKLLILRDQMKLNNQTNRLDSTKRFHLK